MDMIAERTKLTRDQSFKRTVRIGDREVTVNHTLGSGRSAGHAGQRVELSPGQAVAWTRRRLLENQARI